MLENKYLMKLRVLLSKERTRYLLFLIFSMITLFILIVAQAIALMVNGIYEYAGILFEVYTFILIVRIVTYDGLKHKKFKAKSIKIRYIICALLLTIMCLLLPAFYLSLFERKQNPALPLWIIIIQLLLTTTMMAFDIKKYRKERVKYNEYYILYYVIGIISKLIALVLAINAIINMIFPKLYWLVLQQGGLITLLSLGFVVYIVIRSSKVKDIEYNPIDDSNLTHEKISVFLFEYKEIKKLLEDSLEEMNMTFRTIKNLSRRRYVHFNAYYYNKEFVGICIFTKKNKNIFIYYLKIKDSMKHKGYASMILKQLNPEVNNIYAKSEAIINETKDIKDKKIHFFSESNIIDTGYISEEKNMFYSILASKGFNELEYKKTVRLLFKAYNPKIYVR